MPLLEISRTHPPSPRSCNCWMPSAVAGIPATYPTLSAAPFPPSQLQLLDAKGLKRLVLGFLRKHKDNMEARMKHADAPEKFLDSEVDLDEHIKSLLQVWKCGRGGEGDGLDERLQVWKCRCGGWTIACRWGGGRRHSCQKDCPTTLCLVNLRKSVFLRAMY